MHNNSRGLVESLTVIMQKGKSSKAQGVNLRGGEVRTFTAQKTDGTISRFHSYLSSQSHFSPFCFDDFIGGTILRLRVFFIRLIVSWIVPSKALMIEYGVTEDAQMEEYLENVKRLRSQMNVIEEAAAKRSVEEQKQKTAIAALETDISSVRAERKRLNDEAEEMLKEKVNIGSEITEKQRKLSLLETESCTMSQTVELLKQEVTNLLLRLKEKRLSYGKISEELNLKVQKQQEWYNSYKLMIEDPTSGMGCAEKEIFLDKENKNAAHLMQMSSENMGDEKTKRYSDLDLKSAKMKLDELEIKKPQIIEDRVKTQQLLEQVNSKMQSAPSALMEMDVKDLENEHRSLKADKAGELEYLQSLEAQIDQLKNLSYIINCRCGNEYKVELAN